MQGKKGSGEASPGGGSERGGLRGILLGGSRSDGHSAWSQGWASSKASSAGGPEEEQGDVSDAETGSLGAPSPPERSPPLRSQNESNAGSIGDDELDREHGPGSIGDAQSVASVNRRPGSIGGGSDVGIGLSAGISDVGHMADEDLDTGDETASGVSGDTAATAGTAATAATAATTASFATTATAATFLSAMSHGSSHHGTQAHAEGWLPPLPSLRLLHAPCSASNVVVRASSSHTC